MRPPLVLLLLLLPACAAPDTPTAFEFPGERYERVFDAARAELRAAGYTLERVDAARGELLTAPKTVAGFATPLEPESRSLPQLWEDTLNHQPRTVRVRFRDLEGNPPPAGAGEPMRAVVDAVLWRQRSPGWRLETEAIARSRIWLNPDWPQRGIVMGSLTPLRKDDPLARRLTARILERLDEQDEDAG